MEVVVSAAVLILVVLGVMAAIDSVTGTAGANKARTVAATLAEKDQEELRGLRTAELNTLKSLIPAPRTVMVDKVPYTITSDAEWVSDTTGKNISCEQPSGDGSYIRITSKVTSPMTGAKVKPVIMSSIVSPQPGSGTLSAIVKDADGRPVVGLPVQANGPDIASKLTNDAGCAVFGSLKAGSYDVKLDQAGWVDPEGDQAPVQTVTVNAGILSTVEFLYDIAATVNPANIVTKVGTNPPQMDEANSVMIAHSGLQTGFRIAPGTGSAYSLIRLFPFRTEYKIFAGSCMGADPSLYLPTYFDDTPTVGPKLNRGTNHGPIDLLEPSTYIRVRRGTSNLQGAILYAYPTEESCEDVRITMGTTRSDGTVEFPGLPFGDYTLCAEKLETSYSPDRTWHVDGGPIVNHDPAGTPRVDTTTRTTLTIPGTSTTANGGCAPS
jgi:hypothetical protein